MRWICPYPLAASQNLQARLSSLNEIVVLLVKPERLLVGRELRLTKSWAWVLQRASRMRPVNTT
jgi:hypothetical protein